MFSNIVTQQPAARLHNISGSVQNHYDIHAEQPHAMTYEAYSGAAPSCMIPAVSRVYPQLSMRPDAFSDMPQHMPMKPAEHSTGGIGGILENISRRLRCTGLCAEESNAATADDRFNTERHEAPIALASMPSRTCSEPDLRERTNSAASIASSHAEHITPVPAQMPETGSYTIPLKIEFTIKKDGVSKPIDLITARKLLKARDDLDSVNGLENYQRLYKQVSEALN